MKDLDAKSLKLHDPDLELTLPNLSSRYLSFETVTNPRRRNIETDYYLRRLAFLRRVSGCLPSPARATPSSPPSPALNSGFPANDSSKGLLFSGGFRHCYRRLFSQVCSSVSALSRVV